MRTLVRSALAMGLIAGAVFAALAARPHPGTTPSRASADAPAGAALASSTSSRHAGRAQTGGPEVSTAVRFDVSPPLRSITPILTVGLKADDDEPAGPTGIARHDPDPVVQGSPGRGVLGPNIPGTGVSFDGISNLCGCSPPDPNGAIGPNHYVQMVNLHFQIFNRAGVSLYGPAANNTIWAGFGGACQIENAGDPVVLHDQIADRWLFSQFSDTGAPFFNCVAISQTSDPGGPYYRYAFTAPTFPDYPKYGVWRDAYYLNTRESDGGVLGNYALERDQMLIGNPLARQVRFTTTQTNTGPNGLLPADLDGTTLPPAGSPNFFVGTQDNDFGAASDALLLYKFHVDWFNTANSTFTGPTVLPAAAFDSVFPCTTPGGRDCIPQPGTANKIDILSSRQRPTFRLAYRNFGTHESLVTNQSVEASPGIAGVRWYELRSPNGVPFIFQQGTYSPGATDGIHRWMGSIAMDKQGNMGLGYSVSNGTNVFPGVQYTGRLVNDPLGTLPQGEGVIVNGTGSQTGSQRWGDYTSMAIDPFDDCTFWYTNEYIPTTSSIGWRARTGTFKFPGCTGTTAVKVLRLTARWHGSGVEVSWRTASEADALGYNVFRSAGTGPSRKVNRTLIVARQVHGAAYRLVDTAVRRGVAYQYRLQIVDRAGKRSWYSLGSAAS